MNNIYDYRFNELQEKMVEAGIVKFRTKQVWNWLYISLVEQFDDMINVDKKTLEILKENFYIPNYEIVDKRVSEDGSTKVLLEIGRDVIETVMMKHNYGVSVCVTTQIGCKIGCSFCASHLGGFKRNLSTGEIVSQIIMFSRLLKREENRVGHVVIMGIGEPLDNLNNVLGFIDIINDQTGLKIGARHVTLSTSGIVDKFQTIAEYDKQINLAISLHASNDKVRSQIMKINNVYDINMIMDEVERYIDMTNRRVTIEYLMLSGVNDKVEHAYELYKLLKGLNVHVNLIPYNEVKEFAYKASEETDIEKFYDVLDTRHIQVTIRRSRGKDINGACGQLRLNHNDRN